MTYNKPLVVGMVDALEAVRSADANHKFSTSSDSIPPDPVLNPATSAAYEADE